MKFYSNTATLHRYLLAALALLSLQSLSAPADNPDRQYPPAPENWYQVEVILFTQQGNSGAETAPQDYQLKFSEHWLPLIDPSQNAAILHLPVVLTSSVSDYLSNGNSQPSLLRRLSTIGADQPISDNGQIYAPTSAYGTQIPEASIPYKHQSQAEAVNAEFEEVSDLSVEQDATEIFVPVYEQPFQQLGPKLRDLNHSATALDRRHYNVLFHEAWRLQINQGEQSPWVIVKAGSTDTGRYQIEGTMRFYKSRFLHFESNLWRLKFSNNKTNLLELPEIPEKPISPFKELMLKALRFSSRLAALQPPISTNSWDQSIQINQPDPNNRLFDLQNFYNLSSLTPLLDTPRDTTTDRPEDTVGNHQYPIETIWPLNRSQRLQEGEIYYIDHPEMGALVTIKNYIPEPLNRPMQPEVATDLIEDSVKIKRL